MDFSEAKGLIRSEIRRLAGPIRRPMFFPTYSKAVARRIETLGDDVRYATLALAIERVERDAIEGSFAELGVWRGQTSKFMHQQAPARRLYLFDTFQGFPAEVAEPGDDRFKDTSQEGVARYIGDLRNVIFQVGYFPDTAAGLENERFALVMIDCDRYRTALEALQFFYPRLTPGGYFFLHDFNSPESDHGISRAATEFLADKPEKTIEIPDRCGSAVFRKATILQ